MQLNNLIEIISYCDDFSVEQTIQYIQQKHNIYDLINLLSESNEELNIRILFFIQKLADQLNNNHIKALLARSSQLPEKNYPKIAYIVVNYLKSTCMYYDQVIDNGNIPLHLYLILNVYAQRAMLQDRKLYSYNFFELLSSGQYIDLTLQIMEYFFRYTPPQQYDSIVIVLSLLLQPEQTEKIAQQCNNILDGIYTQYVQVIEDNLQKLIDYNLQSFTQALNTATENTRCSLAYYQIKHIATITMQIFTISINSNIHVNDQSMRQIVNIFNILAHHQSIKIFGHCLMFMRKWLFQAKQNHNMLEIFNFDIFINQLIFFVDKNNYMYVFFTEQGNKSNLSPIEKYMQQDLQLDSKKTAVDAYEDIEQQCIQMSQDLSEVKVLQAHFLEYLFTKITFIFDQISSLPTIKQNQLLQPFVAILKITSGFIQSLLFNNNMLVQQLEKVIINQNSIYNQQFLIEYIEYLNKIVVCIIVNGNVEHAGILKVIVDFFIQQIGFSCIGNENQKLNNEIIQQAIFYKLQYIVERDWLKNIYNRSDQLENLFNQTEIERMLQIIYEKSCSTSQELQIQYQNLIFQIQQMFQIQADQNILVKTFTGHLTSILQLPDDQIINIFYGDHNIIQQIELQMKINTLINIYGSQINQNIVNNDINEMMLNLFQKLICVQEQYYIIDYQIINNYCNYTITNSFHQRSHNILVLMIIDIYSVIISSQHPSVKLLQQQMINEILISRTLDIYLVQQLLEKTYSLEKSEKIIEYIYNLVVTQLKHLSTFLFSDKFKIIFKQQITLQYEYDLPDLLLYIRDQTLYKGIGVFLQCTQQYNIDPPLSDVIFMIDITLSNQRLCRRLQSLFCIRQDLFENNIEILYKLTQIIQDCNVLKDIKTIYVGILARYLYYLVKTIQGRDTIKIFLQLETNNNIIIEELRSCTHIDAVECVLENMFNIN